MRKPIKKGEPAVVWSASRFNKAVVRKTYRYPDGKTRDFFLWGKKAAGPVVAFPVTKDGKVLVTKQWRAGVDGFVYELPGGHPKEGQSAEAAMIAELREETGYEADAIFSLAEFWFNPPSLQIFVRPFLALGCKKVARPDLDRDEFMTCVAMPMEKWLKAIMMNSKNNMKDSKSLAITLLAVPELVSRGLLRPSVWNDLKPKRKAARK